MRFPITALALFTITLAACSKSDNTPLNQAQAEQAVHMEEKAAAVATGASAINPALQNLLADDGAGSKVKIDGKARIAVLYFQDQPANRQAVLDWLKDANAKVDFESQRFGYIDAELAWPDLAKLIKKAVAEDMDKKLLMRLELDQVTLKKADAAPAPKRASGPQLPRDNTSFFGPVHSAGYGSGVAEFRRRAAQDLGLPNADSVAGQGITVAVYDAGVDLSRTDVFQNRIKDFPVSDDRAWNALEKTVDDFTKDKHSTKGLEAELADTAVAATLRFAEISGGAEDLNGAGNKKFSFWIAAFQKDGEWQVKMQPASGEAFGDALLDFGRAYEQKKPQIINLYTGKYYARTGAVPSKSAAGVKIRKSEDKPVEVAMVGLYNGADHGIANLHMVGGDYREGNNKYQGVAPAVGFLAMAPWQDGDYGSRWIPLARSIIQATEGGADVLDLDIYTPGTRNASDLLSSLLCRVTRTTNVVPVVASHNYGPLPGTVQNMAQSPCVLAIGAAHSVGAMREAFRNNVLDPSLQNDEQLQTALYSGRGFSQNGLLKPDIISPAYGYTAYGDQMIRFNGTSGATPTTAGVIALLKQAARAKGVELGLPQITMLLQGASREVNASTIRDGFGYTNLDASWTLFQSLYGSKSADQPDPLSPVLLAGQQKLEFEGKPGQNVMSLALVRRASLGSRDEAVPMKFWIEYGGASKDAGWLKFYDSAVATSTDTLEKDMPSHGNSQTLGLALQLDAAQWAALPPGDHVAIVKGVRASLYGKSRAVDFAQPVTIDKPVELDEAEISIRPLYGDQYQILSFATSPGEKLFISAQTSCGKATPSSLMNNRANPFTFVVDNERSYNHASEVMNTYAPMTLSSTPITVTAGRDLTRFAIMRSAMQRCEEAISGRLVVRRTGFKLGASDAEFLRDGDKIKFSARTGIQLTAGALKPAEFNRGAAYKFKVAKATWILRHKVKEKFSFTVPKGTDYARVVPDDYNRFAGMLVGVKADGDVDSQANTDESFLGGFSAAATNTGGGPVGLEVRTPNAGNQLYYLPADDGEDKLAGTVEVAVTNLAAGDIKLDPASADNWGQRETKVLTLKGAFPASLGDELKDFGSDKWSTVLRVQVEAREEANNSRPGFAEDVGMLIWRGTVEIPVSR